MHTLYKRKKLKVKIKLKYQIFDTIKKLNTSKNNQITNYAKCQYVAFQDIHETRHKPLTVDIFFWMILPKMKARIIETKFIHYNKCEQFTIKHHFVNK